MVLRFLSMNYFLINFGSVSYTLKHCLTIVIRNTFISVSVKSVDDIIFLEKSA